MSAAPLAHLHRAAFVQIPLELLLASADRKGLVFVYAWLWHHAGRHDTAFPSIQTLAKECSMKADDVRRALRYLVDEGWITRHDRPGATTLFHVRMEAQRPPDQPAAASAPAPPTPPPNGGPHPSPKRGTPPLPQMGEANKKQLTRTREQEENTPPPSLREGAPPQGAPSASSGVEESPSKRKRRQAATSLELPDHLEAVRPLLESWWALRCKRHRTRQDSQQMVLSSRCLSGLAYANQLGVLQPFAELAAGAGWLSLGFNGHRDYLDKLAAERNLDDCASRPDSCMVSARTRAFPLRSTTRQADAAERAIAMFSAPPDSHGTCSPLPISSQPLQV